MKVSGQCQCTENGEEGLGRREVSGQWFENCEEVVGRMVVSALMGPNEQRGVKVIALEPGGTSGEDGGVSTVKPGTSGVEFHYPDIYIFLRPVRRRQSCPW